jgi:hypothetical protein
VGKVVSVFAVISLILAPGGTLIMPLGAYAVTVTTDSFGTELAGDIPGWDEEGSDVDWESFVWVPTINEFSANGGAVAKVGSGEWMCHIVSAIGYDMLTLSYFWRGDYNSDNVSNVGVVEYKEGNGGCTDESGWIQLQSHQLDQDESWTSQPSFALTETLAHTEFRLRFRTLADASLYFRIDGVEIMGSSITSDGSGGGSEGGGSTDPSPFETVRIGGGSGSTPPAAAGEPEGDPENSEDIGEVLGAVCEPLLATYMREGMRNDTNEVMELQEFLNKELGVDLVVDGFFESETTDAVKQFQLKYADEILAPWVPYGLESKETTTGYVYKTTQRWINKLSCADLDFPMPELP